MAIEHLSYSSANTLNTCGWQWYLTRDVKMPQRPSVPAIAGSVIHASTEAVDHRIHEAGFDHVDQLELTYIATQAARTALEQEIAEAEEHFPDRDQWKRYGRRTQATPNMQDIEWFRENGIPLANQAYINWRLATKFPLAIIDDKPAIEVPFELKVSHDVLPIHGYIDRVFETEQGPLLMDLKSGTKPKNDVQLGTYSVALQEQTGREFRYGTFMHAMKTGEGKVLPPIDLSHWTREKLAYYYGTAELRIKSKTFSPNPGEACQHCPVVQNCAYAISAT